MPHCRTTVSFPDKPDHHAATEAIAVIQRTEAAAGLALAVGQLGVALGFQHYLLLQYKPGQSTHARALHNLAADDQVAQIARSVAVANLLMSPMPLSLPRDLDMAEFQHGIGVSSPYTRISCVLLLGSDRPAPTERDLFDQQGMALVAINHAVEALQRIELAECPLTERELQCLRFAGMGLSGRETAARLRISHRTVEEYIERARGRLGVATTIEAVVAATRNGWITDEEIAEAERISCRRQYGGS